MSNYKNLEAFMEFAYERCNETIMGDEDSMKLNENVLNFERKLRETFTQEQMEIFYDYENAVNEHSAHNDTVLYIQGMKDVISVLD